jgi:hypothetical protein
VLSLLLGQSNIAQAYRDFPPRKIDFGFLTLQSCLDMILVSNGGTTYDTPHMGKERFLRQGMLPVHLHASDNAISVARQVLNANE